MQALRALLTEIVDYAGLFPPAGLPMDQVVSNYATYLASPNAWMLARLIVPASRLPEFETAAADLLPTTPGATPWLISSLVPAIDAENDAFTKSMNTIAIFNDRHTDAANGLAIVDVIEGKAQTAAQIEETIDVLPDNLAAFLELPHNRDPRGLITSLSGVQGVHAKIRTGGVTPELIPSTEEVARFLAACAAAEVGFKATAGLHHPVRAEYALTYEANAPKGTMHGFLNVFMAACLLREGAADEALAQEILSEQDQAAFQFEETAAGWRDLLLPAEALAAAREGFCASFGSCSFTEPLEDLAAISPL